MLHEVKIPKGWRKKTDEDGTDLTELRRDNLLGDLCKCGHMRDEHLPRGGECAVPKCKCNQFTWCGFWVIKEEYWKPKWSVAKVKIPDGMPCAIEGTVYINPEYHEHCQCIGCTFFHLCQYLKLVVELSKEQNERKMVELEGRISRLERKRE